MSRSHVYLVGETTLYIVTLNYNEFVNLMGLNRRLFQYLCEKLEGAEADKPLDGTKMPNFASLSAEN
jgi:hypothetical protein